jgi:hypothetical protein
MNDRLDKIRQLLAEKAADYEEWTAGDDVVLHESAGMVAHGRGHLAWCVAEIERLRVLVSRLHELPAWWLVQAKSGPVCLWCRAPATWPDGDFDRVPDCDHVGRCPVPAMDAVTP